MKPYTPLPIFPHPGPALAIVFEAYSPGTWRQIRQMSSRRADIWHQSMEKPIQYGNAQRTINFSIAYFCVWALQRAE